MTLRLFFTLIAISLLAPGVIGQETPKAKLVDEIAHVDCEVLWSRLDGFAHELGLNPTAVGRVEISGDAGKPPHVDFYWFNMIRDYAAYRRIDPTKWQVRRVARGSGRLVRFWLVPFGAPAPDVEEAEWPFTYPPDTKPFILTNGENYSVDGNGTCLPVDEYDLLASALKANPGARVNVVLITPTERVYRRRKTKTLRMLTKEYSIPASRIRFFRKAGNPKPGYPDPNAEYWFVPKLPRPAS